MEEIEFVDGVTPSLPKDIHDDNLAIMIQVLMSRVKTDHSKSGFNVDVRHYAKLVTGIVQFARQNGYKKVSHLPKEFNENTVLGDKKESEKTKEDSSDEVEKDDIDWDSIS
jgi:hypothetical protein